MEKPQQKNNHVQYSEMKKSVRALNNDVAVAIAPTENTLMSALQAQSPSLSDALTRP